MTLKELKRAVDVSLESQLGNTHDAVVMVQMNEPGIPTNPMVKVRSASLGFDWTHGRFIIITEEPVVRKKKS